MLVRNEASQILPTPIRGLASTSGATNQPASDSRSCALDPDDQKEVPAELPHGRRAFDQIIGPVGLRDRRGDSLGACCEVRIPVAHQTGMTDSRQPEVEGGSVWIGGAAYVVPIEQVFSEIGVPARLRR